MDGVETRTFTLPVEEAAFIDEQVRTGSFASVSDVVRAGLRALQEHDAVERWLRDEVVATYDATMAHPERLISSEDMAERMRRRHEARLKQGT